MAALSFVSLLLLQAAAAQEQPAYAPGTSPTHLHKNLTVRASHSIPSAVTKAANVSRTVDVTGSRDVRLTAPRVRVEFTARNNTHLQASDSDVFDTSDDEAFDIVGTGSAKARGAAGGAARAPTASARA